MFSSKLRQHPDPTDPGSVLSNLAFEGLREQKRRRRWGIFFKTLFALYLVVLTGFYFYQKYIPTVGGHTALVEMNGVIGVSQDIDADSAIRGLRSAFESDTSKGVILRINSPGGSPVQASQINKAIGRLRTEFPNKPLYAVIEDVCASGGYYIAVAASEIFANESSLVGSIGAVLGTFGFTEVMKKLGVERRLLTAGERKGILDPFSPFSQEDEQHMQTMLNEIHELFISTVKNGRGDRLNDDGNVFSGLVWTGKRALELGLIDGFESIATIAKERIGADKIINYTADKNLIDRIAERVGASIGHQLIESLVRSQDQTPTLN